jgi:hypothetical protein
VRSDSWSSEHVAHRLGVPLTAAWHVEAARVEGLLGSVSIVSLLFLLQHQSLARVLQWIFELARLAAKLTLTNETDRWAPIIKAAGEYAD